MSRVFRGTGTGHGWVCKGNVGTLRAGDLVGDLLGLALNLVSGSLSLISNVRGFLCGLGFQLSTPKARKSGSAWTCAEACSEGGGERYFK